MYSFVLYMPLKWVIMYDLYIYKDFKYINP